jgi:hypothetical protein
MNFTTVQNVIQQILTYAELQDFAKQGINDGKKLLRVSLCSLAADGSRKLVTFAKFTSNAVLLREIKISESALNHLADTDLRTKAQEIYDRAQTNITALPVYGITAASQTALLNAITAFNVSIPKPRLGIDERKQATQQLSVLFKTLHTAFDNMDAAVEIVRLTQPSFYNGYKTARRVIVTGSGSIAAKGVVTDAATGEPLKGAKVVIATANGTAKLKAANDNGEIVKKTADKGGYTIKSLPEGTYTFTVSRPGYRDAVVTVNVTDGHLSVVNVKLEKI